VLDDNVILAGLPVVPVVFWGFILTLFILWMRRERITTRHEKAKRAFAEALATKNIKIDPTDVTTEQGHGGAILCKVVYGRALYAQGEFRANGMVFVRFYPRPENDPQRSFWHPATH
jgi:hypothetical protein